MIQDIYSLVLEIKDIILKFGVVRNAFKNSIYVENAVTTYKFERVLYQSFSNGERIVTNGIDVQFDSNAKTCQFIVGASDELIQLHKKLSTMINS